MEIYKKMHDAIYCKDFIQYSYNLLDFANMALREKNRGTLVKHFYQSLREFGLTEYVFANLTSNRKRYLIYDGEDSVSKFMALAMPPQETPVKSLRSIQKFAQKLITNYTEPIGEHITKEQLIKIMEYLDEKYNFSEKVFSDKRAIFSILDVSNQLYNSECLVLQSEREITQHFFLYCMNGNDESITPEAVLFHELGHAIHARYAGTIETVPENVLLFLQDLCMPNIASCSSSEQCEVFADVLSVGLMYESPFAEFDPFSYMRPYDKKAFKQMTEVILEKL